MSTEIEVGKNALEGALHIFIGKIISRVIGILGGVILIRLLADPAKYGIINIAIVLPQIFMLFTDLGIDTAMTKYIAESRSKGDVRSVKNAFYSGLLMKIPVSILFTVLCAALSTFFSTFLLGKPYISPFVSIASILVMGWAISSFCESVFMGFDATKIYGAFLVINELLLSSLPLILFFYGQDVFGVLVGMVLAVGITALLEAIACLSIIHRLKKEDTTKEKKLGNSFGNSAKKILIYGLPLQAVLLMHEGIGKFYSFLLASNCTDDQIGYFSISQKGYAFVDYITWPISLVLFPAFSKIDFKNHGKALEKTFKYSIKYSSLVVLPAVVLLMALSRPLINVIFGSEYEYAFVYLLFLGISGLFYALGSVHLRKLLLAQGETKFIAKLDALTTLIGAISAMVIIPQFKIFGYIAISIFVWWPEYLLMLRKLHKTYHISVPLKDVWKLYPAASAAGIAAFLSSYFISNEILELIIGVFLGILAYCLFILAFKVINLADIENLREMTNGQQIIGFLAEKMLKIVEKLYRLLHT